MEYICGSKQEEVNQIKKILTSSSSGTTGIIAKDRDYLNEFKKEFHNNPKVHCLNMQEAQGVEFEKVCLVGVNESTFSVQGLPPTIIEEATNIQRDLLYVALTRAMLELHCMGTKKLKMP